MQVVRQVPKVQVQYVEKKAASGTVKGSCVPGSHYHLQIFANDSGKRSPMLHDVPVEHGH